MPLHGQSLRCASHPRVKLHTGESKSKLLLASGCLQRDNQNKSFQGEHIYLERKHLKYKYSFSKKNCLTLRFAAHHGDNFMIKYLSEIKTEFLNTEGCFSIAQIGLNREKIEVENLVTQSL